MFRHKTAQPMTCASSTTPPAEQRACAGALTAAARLRRLHHEVSELFDWIIVALASVVLYDACKTHIYPVYFWVSFDDHEAITTLSCGRAALRGANGRSPRKALPGRGLLRLPRLHGAARRWAPFTVEGRHNLAVSWVCGVSLSFNLLVCVFLR